MIVSLLWMACSNPPAPVELPAPPSERQVALVFSHDLDGEIEPCG